ncbi:hypothetical protein BDV93DRAFT_545984 [Ceratobasidium sp. AG-I]|nr:hypothetical protein BDV93DRAFT_545984 [Ceratobasidium sp. AG-I]
MAVPLSEAYVSGVPSQVATGDTAPSGSRRKLAIGLKSLAPVLKSSGNILGLPGVSELVNGIECFIKRLNVSGEKHKEHALLSSRLQNLLGLLNQFPASQLASMDTVITQLHQIQLKTNITIKNASASTVMLMESNLEQYERLMGQVDHLVELLHLQQMQKLLTQHEDNQLAIREELHDLAKVVTEVHQSIQHLGSMLARLQVDNKEEGILIIHSSQITTNSGEMEHAYTIQESSWRRNSSTYGSHIVPLANSSSKIFVNATTGYRHNVRVFRRSYNSTDPLAAVQCARRELEWLSKYFNHNVAQLIGGFKTSNGLQEVVMNVGRMPSGLFLVKTHSPEALSRFIKGLYNVIELQANHSSQRCVSSTNISDAECVTVNPDGHVIVLPPSSLGDLYVDVGDIIRSCCRYGSLDPAVEVALQVYNNNGWLKEPERKFCELISALPSLTKLEVMDAANYAGVMPPPKFSIWCSDVVPPFTLTPFDLGFNSKSDKQPNEWTTLGSNPDLSRELGSLHAIGTSRNYRLIPRSDNWQSYEMDSGCTGINWYMGVQEMDSTQWQDFKRCAQSYAETNDIDPGLLSTVFNMSFSIGTKYQSEIPKRPLVVTTDRCIYFHRNPSLRNDPFRFWGFISSNSDPTAPSPLSSSFNGLLTYTVHYRFLTFYDDYGYQREKMIADGLDAMPGCYPAI